MDGRHMNGHTDRVDYRVKHIPCLQPCFSALQISDVQLSEARENGSKSLVL